MVEWTNIKHDLNWKKKIETKDTKNQTKNNHTTKFTTHSIYIGQNDKTGHWHSEHIKQLNRFHNANIYRHSASICVYFILFHGKPLLQFTWHFTFSSVLFPILQFLLLFFLFYYIIFFHSTIYNKIVCWFKNNNQWILFPFIIVTFYRSGACSKTHIYIVLMCVGFVIVIKCINQYIKCEKKGLKSALVDWNKIKEM